MHTKSNWPSLPTLFIGRRRELAKISQLLADPACRLLTLLGPGGAGKTRLAVAAAEQHASQFRDGIFLVPLQAVPSADDLVSAVADALQLTFRAQAEPEVQLVDRLRDRQMLLILDNLEHLLTGSGHDTILRVLGNVVRFAPAVKVLVTSREVLHMQEEWILSIDGLPYAALDTDQVSDAIALFADRARRARVDFDLADEGQAVARICQLVEGNPLALELAAAWTRSLSCAAIAAEIERDLRFLTSQQRNTPARHASIEAVFRQSWTRLTEEEQRVLRRLSVFRGDCTQDAAQEIAGAILSVLAALVDRSLLRHTRPGRYHLHELLRQFAAEELDRFPEERENTLDGHRDYYLSLLHRLTGDLQGGRQIEAQETLTADVRNGFAAWRRAVAQMNATALGRAAVGLVLFCDQSGRFHEGHTLFQFAAERFAPVPEWKRPEGTPEPESGQSRQQEIVLAQMQTGQGMCLLRLGKMVESQTLLEECVANLRMLGLDDRQPLAFALYWLAHARLFQGHYQEAKETLLECLALFTEMDDAWGIGGSLFLLGSTASYRGDFTEADSFLEMSERQLRSIGEHRLIAYCISFRGVIALGRGEYDRAEKWLLDALAIRREIDDLWSIGYSTRELGSVATAQGDYAAAQVYLEECLSAFRETGAYGSTIFPLDGLGTLARLRGDLQEAEQLYRQALAISDEIHERRGEARCRLNLGRLAIAERDYAMAEEFLHASLEIYQAIGNQTGVGFSASQLGAAIGMAPERRAEASVYFAQALDIGTEIGAPPVVLDVLLGWATTLLAGSPADEERIHSAGLLALVSEHTASTHEMKRLARDRLAGLSTPGPAHKSYELDEAAATVRRKLAALMGDEPAPPSSAPAPTEEPSLPDWVEPLTSREIQVLALIEHGLTNREIAEHLVLSLGTVKWYTSQIYSKLGVRNRSQAVHTARRYHLLS